MANLTKRIRSTNSSVNNVRIVNFNFNSGNLIHLPKAVEDQNYVNSALVLSNDHIFTSSIIIDDAGWQRWVTSRSTDLGLTWEVMDLYAAYEDGASQPLSIVENNNTIYVCGYIWQLGGDYNSEWIVRESSDNGATWSTSDHHASSLGENHVCQSIANNPLDDSLISIGYEADFGLIREKEFGSGTWTTIGTFPDVNNFVSIDISPTGIVWLIAKGSTAPDFQLIKGEKIGGIWNWSAPIVVDPGVTLQYGYQISAKVLLLSETEALITAPTSGGWKNYRTTDSGGTWTNTYTSPSTSDRGHDLIELPSGDIISSGHRRVATNNHTLLLKSDDSGANWTEVFYDTTVNAEGQRLALLSDGSVLSIGYHRPSSQNRILISTDNGDNFSFYSYHTYFHNIWQYLNDYTFDSSGNFWTTTYSPP